VTLLLLLSSSSLLLRPLQVRRHHLEAFFIIHAFIDQHFILPSLTSFRVPPHYIRNFTLFSLARKNCQSARCATAANLLHNYIDVFSMEISYS
jgi:hypothetical protein